MQSKNIISRVRLANAHISVFSGATKSTAQGIRQEAKESIGVNKFRRNIIAPGKVHNAKMTLLAYGQSPV